MRQEMHPGSVLCGSWNRVKEPLCGMESGGRGRAHVPGLAVTCRANRRLPSRADTTYSPGRRRQISSQPGSAQPVPAPQCTSPSQQTLNAPSPSKSFALLCSGDLPIVLL